MGTGRNEQARPISVDLLQPNLNQVCIDLSGQDYKLQSYLVTHYISIHVKFFFFEMNIDFGKRE